MTHALKHVLPATWCDAQGISIGGVPLSQLADRFGTPLYIIDERHVESRLRGFREAFGPEAGLVYAGKAFLCGALVQLLDREGWLIDAVSAGELELAHRAGLDASRIVMHGNAKTDEELAQAVRLGVGRVVVDHLQEIDLLVEQNRRLGRADRPMRVLLRLNIDLAPETHAKVTTVGPTAHFGMEPETASEAARRVSAAEGLTLGGVHIHAGSQIRDLRVFCRAGEALVEFVAPLRDRFAETVELDVGGGLAVPYLAEDQAPEAREYAEAIVEGLGEARASERLGAYRILVEPGRSVIANGGVTLYRVQARKTLPGLGQVLAVDGGLSDNPRPSLYDARYEILNGSRAHAKHDTPFRVVGRHCESGDVIAPSVLLPAETDRGDLIVLPVTGAYVYAMSSRYNGVGRAPVVFVRDGAPRLVVRGETHDDLLACDVELS